MVPGKGTPRLTFRVSGNHYIGRNEGLEKSSEEQADKSKINKDLAFPQIPEPALWFGHWWALPTPRALR